MISEAKYYKDIHRLPLNLFINVAVDSDFASLIISGSPKDDDLENAWKEIVNQYNDCLARLDHKMMRTISIYRSAVYTDFKINAVESFIQILKEVYVKKMADEVNKLMLTNFKFDVHNQKDYDNDIKRVAQRLRGLKIQLKIDQSKVEAWNKEIKENETSTPDREYFSKILINLSDYAGYQIREDQITVFEFCERIKRCERAANTLKK